MTFLLQLLWIRIKQSWRAMLDVGFLLILALPMGILSLIMACNELASLDPLVWSGLTGVLFLVLHYQRKDGYFLQKGRVYVPLIYGVEYQLALLLLVTGPLAIWYQAWTGTLISHLLVAAIAFIPPRRTSGLRRAINLDWLPRNNLEWLSGIRKYWWLLLPVYGAGLIAAAYLPGPLLSLLILMLMILGFYDELENRILLERALQPHFLWKKWWAHYRLFCLLMLPHIGLFLWFHASYWYLLIFCLVISGIFLACAIFYKYSTYLPGRRRANHQTAMSLIIMTLFIPFLSPLSLIALFIFHRKAQKRLRYFFPHAGA